jgi:hypothetical protein
MPNSSPSPAKNVRKDAKPQPRAGAKEPKNGAGTASATDEQIARRAYEIYEREGRQPGRELENWLRAEAELTGQSTH